MSETRNSAEFCRMSLVPDLKSTRRRCWGQSLLCLSVEILDLLGEWMVYSGKPIYKFYQWMNLLGPSGTVYPLVKHRRDVLNPTGKCCRVPPDGMDLAGTPHDFWTARIHRAGQGACAARGSLVTSRHHRRGDPTRKQHKTNRYTMIQLTRHHRSCKDVFLGI